MEIAEGGLEVAIVIDGGTPMREPQVRLTNISKEIDRGTALDMVGNPTGVSELTACLFDLRTAHEAELRTLTWIQKTLEGLRTGRECGDADLLLREMARLIKESEGKAACIAGHRRSAAELLSAVIGESGSSARETKPLAIAAA
jgi:hypothetical protein